jgi:hypothetical protein
MNSILRRVLGENDDVESHLAAGHAGVPPEGRQYPPPPPPSLSAGGESEESTELELLDRIKGHAIHLEEVIGELGRLAYGRADMPDGPERAHGESEQEIVRELEGALDTIAYAVRDYERLHAQYADERRSAASAEAQHQHQNPELPLT